MISYTLKCENQHAFDSWFKSSEDYNKLKAAGLLECMICGSNAIEKSLMAPKISGQRQNKTQDQALKTREKIREELKSARNVGWQFAKEARAIHKGEKESEMIYGKTDPEEAMELLREGIGIAPLPFDPDAKEN